MRAQSIKRFIPYLIVIVLVASIIYVLINFFVLKENVNPIRLYENEVQMTDYNGKSITFREQPNEPIIINFWASWCTACVNELPLLNASYKLDHFNMITVNISDSKETINKYVERYDLVLPIINDSQFKQYYNVSALPLTLVINSEGDIIHTFQGEITAMEQILRLKQYLKAQ